MKSLNPANPVHLWRLRKELGAYAKWSLGAEVLGPRQTRNAGRRFSPIRSCPFRPRPVPPPSDRLERHSAKHQLKLADRQCRMAEVSQRVQDTVVILVAALWAGRQQSEAVIAAADVLCQDFRRKLTGGRPTDAYFRDVGKLADMVLAGGYEALAGVPADEILMRYDTK